MSLEDCDSFCFVCGWGNIQYDMETGNHYCPKCDDYMSMVNGVNNK